MPLRTGKKNIAWNIHELSHNGKKRSHKQIVAIAARVAYGAKSPRKSKRTRRGKGR